MNNLIKFDNFSFNSLNELAKESYKYPNRFYKYFSSNQFTLLLRKLDIDKYQKLLEIKKQELIPDIFTFKVSYLLNPYMKLAYHHFIFSNYIELAKQMQVYAPTVDIYLKDLFTYHLLSDYMKNNREDIRYKKIYKYVLQAEKESEENSNKAYWNFMFNVLGDNNFYYKGKTFTSEKEFFQYIFAIPDLLEFSSNFLDDSYLLTYLERKGYKYKISKFLSLIRLVDKLDEKAKEEMANEILNKINK